jgi:hypothetical protein
MVAAKVKNHQRMAAPSSGFFPAPAEPFQFGVVCEQIPATNRRLCRFHIFSDLE